MTIQRYKIYMLIAILLCALGFAFNFVTQSNTGHGALIIFAGGTMFVLGLTIKKKSENDSTGEN